MFLYCILPHEANGTFGWLIYCFLRLS